MEKNDQQFNFTDTTEINLAEIQNIIKSLPDDNIEKLIKYCRYLKYSQTLNCINKLNNNNIDTTK